MQVIPPYFAYQRTEKDGVVTITTLDFELNSSLLPADKDLIVYANDLTINGNLTIPGKNIVINARKVISENGKIDTSGGEPEKDFSLGNRAKDGDNGVDYGSDGKAGESGEAGSAGQNAGNITVVAEQFVNPINLIANGGRGGRGQDGGNGGTGHDGKPGADAKIQKSLSRDSIVAQPAAGGQGGNGGNGGDAGKSGDGGDGGNIFVGIITQEPDTTMSYEGGVGGETAKPGKGGNPGQGGLGGRKAECHSHYVAGDVVTNCNYINERVSPGSPGSPGKSGNSISATRGHAGSANKSNINYSDFLSKYTSTIEQRTLTFHKMKLAYLGGQYDDTKELLTWLRMVTPQQEDSANAWGYLNQQVTALLVQLNQGLDYYGYSWSHVPLVSLEYYQRQLDSLLILGNQIEKVYKDYLDSENDQLKQQSAFQSALDYAQGNLEKLEKIKDNVTNEKTKTQDTIAHITEEQLNQERILFLSEQKFQDALMQYFELTALLNFCQMMTSLVIIGADVYNAGKAIFNICGELSKEAIEFKNMIKQVKEIGGKASDIKKQWDKIKDINTPENPDTAKLVMKREEFDEVMKQFVDEFPEAKEYQNQVHTYLDIVQNRNQKVIEYNTLAIKEIELAAEIKQKKTELKEIKDHWASEKDPTLPLMRMYMLNLYEGFKKNVLDYLYQENQAFRYWSLSWDDFSVGDNTIAEMSAFHADLKGKITDLLNARGKPVQPFKNIKIVLKRTELPNEFKSFQERSKLSFSIPITSNEFMGLGQVIATNFTIEIKNASTDNDQLYVLLTSSGRAPFLNLDGHEFVFSHSAVTALYKYHITTGEYIAGGMLGGDNDEYIGLSPFTTWTIEIPSKFNPGLNLGTVNEIVLSFSGRGLPMSPGAEKNVKVLVL